MVLLSTIHCDETHDQTHAHAATFPLVLEGDHSMLR
jgi:hypothetical protein